MSTPIHPPVDMKQFVGIGIRSHTPTFVYYGLDYTQFCETASRLVKLRFDIDIEFYIEPDKTTEVDGVAEERLALHFKDWKSIPKEVQKELSRLDMTEDAPYNTFDAIMDFIFPDHENFTLGDYDPDPKECLMFFQVPWWKYLDEMIKSITEELVK